MWEPKSLWIEVAVVSPTVALGHLFLGHFEERTPRIRKFMKYFISSFPDYRKWDKDDLIKKEKSEQSFP